MTKYPIKVFTADDLTELNAKDWELSSLTLFSYLNYKTLSLCIKNTHAGRIGISSVLVLFEELFEKFISSDFQIQMNYLHLHLLQNAHFDSYQIHCCFRNVKMKIPIRTSLANSAHSLDFLIFLLSFLFRVPMSKTQI